MNQSGGSPPAADFGRVETVGEHRQTIARLHLDAFRNMRFGRKHAEQGVHLSRPADLRADDERRRMACRGDPSPVSLEIDDQDRRERTLERGFVPCDARELGQERPGPDFADAMVQRADDGRVGDRPGARRHPVAHHVDQNDPGAAGHRKVKDQVAAAGLGGPAGARNPVAVDRRRQEVVEKSIHVTHEATGEAGVPDRGA